MINRQNWFHYNKDSNNTWNNYLAVPGDGHWGLHTSNLLTFTINYEITQNNALDSTLYSHTNLFLTHVPSKCFIFIIFLKQNPNSLYFSLQSSHPPSNPLLSKTGSAFNIYFKSIQSFIHGPRCTISQHYIWPGILHLSLLHRIILQRVCQN